MPPRTHALSPLVCELCTQMLHQQELFSSSLHCQCTNFSFILFYSISSLTDTDKDSTRSCSLVICVLQLLCGCSVLLSRFQNTNLSEYRSLLLHVTCTISSQSSLLNPLDHLHWSLFSNHQLTPVSRSQIALVIMLVPYQSGASPNSSPSHHQAMSLDDVFHPRLKTLHSHLSLAQAQQLEFDHSVFGSHWR